MVQYEVRKEKGGRYYVCPVGRPDMPLKGSYSGDKKKAIKYAAVMCGMPLKEYMKARKENGNE